jgi:hypothetical protein
LAHREADQDQLCSAVLGTIDFTVWKKQGNKRVEMFPARLPVLICAATTDIKQPGGEVLTGGGI